MADDVLEVEIDGVPAFWVPSDTRDLTAGIIFRVGLSDEPFAQRGFTHLVEHLALSALNVDYDYNGFVDSTTTNFIVRGSTDDVLDFIETTVAALHQLPYDRLDVERKVLLAESERNGVSATATALALLYGANGVGAVALPETGLWRATSDTLERWLAEWFTRENMVIWFAGPEPKRPSLVDVRSGRRRQTVLMERCRSKGAGYFVDPVPGPGMVNVVDRSPLVNAGLAMVTDRLTARLRTAEGMSYSVNANVQPLTASTTILTLVADCRPEDADDVFSIMVTELNRFAFDGPTAGEVDDYVRKRRRAIDDEGAPVAQASTTAYHYLQGASPLDPAKALAVVEAAHPASFAKAVENTIRSAMWVVPPGTTVRDQRFTPVSMYSRTDVDAPAYPSTFSDVELVIDGGLLAMADDANPLAFAMPIHELVGVVAYEDGAHSFYRRDAVSLTVQPADYPGCEADYGRYLARVPDAMVVAVPRPLRTEADLAEIERLRVARSPVRRTVAAARGRFRPGNR